MAAVAREPVTTSGATSRARTSIETVQRAKPEEVEIELRAQVEMALAAGIDVTHLDSHMGTVFFPPFLESYKKLAAEFRVPVFAVCPDPQALAARGLQGATEILNWLVGSLESEGFPILDGFDTESLDFAEGEGLEHNRGRIEGLGTGINYLICHPAHGGEELSTITSPGSSRPSWMARSIMCRAMRSLTLPVGLRNSTLAKTSPG